MLVCKDCRWFDLSESATKSARYGACNAPQNAVKRPEIDTLVDGEPRPHRRFTYCSTLRGSGFWEALFGNLCGRSGRWFEPAVSDGTPHAA